MLPTLYNKSDIEKRNQRYDIMLEVSQTGLINAEKTAESFYKSSSQLKTVSLDINDLTPISTIKHITAAIEQTKDALKESQINILKQELKIKRIESRIEVLESFDKEEAEIELLEALNVINHTRNYQGGAIKRLAHLIAEYESICEKLGVEYITEEMHENDEARSQTMRCISQALAAARARGGLIDEGNFIFLQDLGINGGIAQREVTAFLKMEEEIIDSGQIPTFELQYNWISAFADKYSPEVSRYIKARGLIPRVDHALAQPLSITTGEKDPN